MKNYLKPLTLFILFLFFLSIANSTYAIDAVASIKSLRGQVEVMRNSTTLAARTGLILNDKDVVITYQKSKVTIIFRDGSEIRLFPNTRFIIEKSEESESGPRKFLHNFRLKLGSFWGKFTRKRQETVVRTPTATAGIKGTTVAFSERKGIFDVSLSSGSVSVQNQSETIVLNPGEMAKGITPSGSIQDRIIKLPYRITITPDQNEIVLPEEGNETEIFFTLQLIDTRTNENVGRQGEVYISVVTDKIIFENDINLNERGYARIKAIVNAFDKPEDNMGSVEVFALMDGEEYMDTGSSSTVITLKSLSGNQQKLKIDASTGDVGN